MADAKPTVLFIPLLQSPEGYPEPYDVVNDGIAVGGIYFQDSATIDDLVGLYRLGSDLILEDPNAGAHTLSSLLSGGGFDPNSMILNVDGSLVYIEDGDICLKSV